jgi:hypothetical protein
MLQGFGVASTTLLGFGVALTTLLGFGVASTTLLGFGVASTRLVESWFGERGLIDVPPHVEVLEVFYEPKKCHMTCPTTGPPLS